MLKNICIVMIGFSSLILFAGGCAHQGASGNKGQVQSYSFTPIESGWIRAGESLEYDGALWLPVDDVESLLDDEVYQVGEYKGVQVFVEKIDAKPYNRLYTKFAKGKFRYYERARND